MNDAYLKKMIPAIAVAWVGFAFLATRTLAADSAAVQEARKFVQAKQYPDALKTISQALAISRPTDPSGDRYDLLMLRGECLIQSNQRLAAANAFDMAVKSAPDHPGAAVARANALLVRASPSGKYIPKTPGQQPIDISDADSRKLAFAAMRDDLRAALQPKLSAALAGTTLTPMMAVLPSLLDLANLEYASDGSLTKTSPDLVELGARARELMQAELRRISYEMNSLEEASNSTDMLNRRGLTSPQRQSLSETADYVRQIGETARNARQHARDLGFDGAPWEPIIADSDDLADRIHGILSVNP
jgi:hypothetical protein